MYHSEKCIFRSQALKFTLLSHESKKGSKSSKNDRNYDWIIAVAADYFSCLHPRRWNQQFQVHLVALLELSVTAHNGLCLDLHRFKGRLRGIFPPNKTMTHAIDWASYKNNLFSVITYDPLEVPVFCCVQDISGCQPFGPWCLAPSQ